MSWCLESHARCYPGKKSCKSCNEVGIFIGKHDEAKGFKLYLPRERLFITKQHVKNVETIGTHGNQNLQQYLRKEDPDLDQAMKERDKATKLKDYIVNRKRLSKRGSRGKGKA